MDNQVPMQVPDKSISLEKSNDQNQIEDGFASLEKTKNIKKELTSARSSRESFRADSKPSLSPSSTSSKSSSFSVLWSSLLKRD